MHYRLDLTSNYFESVSEAIQNISTLQRLTLDENQLESYPEDLEFLNGYPSLKYLSLSHMTINIYPRLPTTITHLRMRGLDKPLPILTYMKNLKTVDFSDTSALYDSPNENNLPPSVTNLIFSNTGFSESETNFSTVFLGLHNLESLNVSNSKGLFEIASEFPNSKSLKNLRVLDMSNCPIRKLSKKAFRKLSNLEVIGLNGTNLDYIDPSWFKHNKKLQTLRISGNPWNCTEKFLKALKDFKKERYILEDSMTAFPRLILLKVFKKT